MLHPLPLVALLLALAGSAPALCHNLEGAWSDTPSAPFNPRLTFWSRAGDDLLFDDGDAIEITCQGGARSVALAWTLARNQFTTAFRAGPAEPLPGNRFRIRLATTGLRPGFYDLRVRLDSGAKDPVEGVCGFGWRIRDLPPAAPRPADFADFWARGLAELAALPLAAEAEALRTFTGAEIDDYNLAHAVLPRDFDPAGHRAEAVESGKISFAGVGGLRIHAWLAKPVGPGPFPALLVLPGAGFAARPRPLEHARHGYLAIDIQVHGQEVDLPDYPKLPGYYDPRWEPLEQAYMRAVYLNCVQAVSYLASRGDVDARRIAVVGGSQGGRLSVVVPALDRRVRAAVPAIPHYGNRAYQAWADACNAAGGDGMDRDAPPPRDDSPAARGEAYFDPLNFAPDVRCPVFMNCGLIDGASPPAQVWPVFQALGSSDKTIVPLPGFGHDWSAEFDRRALRWLERVLAVEAAGGSP